MLNGIVTLQQRISQKYILHIVFYKMQYIIARDIIFIDIPPTFNLISYQP